MDLLDKKQKKVGSIVFETQYIWKEPPDPAEEDEEGQAEGAPVIKRDKTLFPLNKKCTVVVTIVEATFLKDADVFGKQDPFIRFTYAGNPLQTTVAEDAGKHAVWKEKFTLANVE